MSECDKPLTHAGNIKWPSIPVVIGWVKTMSKPIPVEMANKSYLKCGISNKMGGIKDDALCEDFLGEGVAETEDVADNYCGIFSDWSKHYIFKNFFGRSTVPLTAHSNYIYIYI